MPVQTLLAQWREANRAAFEAEHVLFEATMRFTSGQGPKPTEEQVLEAKVCRAQCTQLYAQLMAQFGKPTPYVPSIPYGAQRDEH